MQTNGSFSSANGEDSLKVTRRGSAFVYEFIKNKSSANGRARLIEN